MKITYNWLKDFVAITLPPGKLADRLTMAGLTVESVEEKDGDAVFTVEVTSNRPDWLSVRGIAREIAALTGKRLKTLRPAVKGGKGKVPLIIEDKKDCPLYTARTLRGVKVADSPGWMRARLGLAGVRPVNNVVDITNYVLLELGEPLHAFDLDKLGLPVSVRRARKGEKLVAIDGKEYLLDPGVLVIADSRGPVAIAGVMGGKETEVGAATKNVLLEAAVFDPVLVRRGRQKLGMQSEASYRFERGIDPRVPDFASRRACQLITEICGGSLVGSGSAGSFPGKEKAIDFDPQEAGALLGAHIAPAQVKRLLLSLGFGVKAKGKKKLSVRVPSFRGDVRSPVDLVEETARIYGYERIPEQFPGTLPQAEQKDDLLKIVREALICQGLSEAITYSLTDRQSAEEFFSGSRLVEVANPLSAEQEVLRPTLLTGLCRCVAHNLRQRQAGVEVFEIARTYALPDKENERLAIAVSGNFSRWFGPEAGNVQYKADFLRLKGVIDALLDRLGIATDELSRQREYQFTGDLSGILRVKGKAAGLLKKLSGRERERFDIKEKDVYLAELALDQLLPLAGTGKKFRPLPRFPSITRDVTLELRKNAAPVGEILREAVAQSGGLMEEAAFRDSFQRGLPQDRVRVTISCVYGSKDRTLTEVELAPVHARVVEALKNKFFAQVR